MSLNSLQNFSVPNSGMDAKTDIYTDLNGLSNLKTSARKDAKGALPEVARQFEAVMISMMIKNLRKTGMEDPLFKSQAMDSYRDMYDQQLGMELSKGQGIGFAKTIVEQMQYQVEQQSPSEPSNAQAEPSAIRQLQLPKRQHFVDHYSSAPEASMKMEAGEVNKTVRNDPSDLPEKFDLDEQFKSPEQFVEQLWPMAEKAAQQLGISPELLLSQSALETGWGKHVIAEGKNSSHNLFNIKADQSWSGGRMEKISTEFLASKKVQLKSDFRSYDSFEQSFDDYVHFIKNNPRYEFNSELKSELKPELKLEQSLHDKTYIEGIHKAGYATDPNYSKKILNVINSETIQSQRIKVALK